MIYDFKSLLKDAGITKAELARKFDINPRTVSGWGTNPPQYVMEYLVLLIKYNRIKP